MDPAAGNFFDPTTLHSYLYTHDNPANWRDPSCRDIVEDVSIRAWIFKNITAPAYIRAGVAAVGGAKGVIAVGTGLAWLTVDLYELFECTSEWIKSELPSPSPIPTINAPNLLQAALVRMRTLSVISKPTMAGRRRHRKAILLGHRVFLG
jgi:hypothetical protein